MTDSLGSRRPPGPELAYVKDLTSPGGLAVRHYRASPDPRPLVVYFHGGAFVKGDLDSHDWTCRRIALESDVEVMAVDYRLAPEHPYPAAIEDAVEVLRWVKPEAVAGDSSGGYLATMACLRLRDAGEALPAVQALLCPNTDLTLAQPSVEEKGDGWGLDVDWVREAIAQWTAEPAAASPLFAEDLSGMPTALIVTAEHDPLRDEGDAYAARLAESGVRVVHRQEAGLAHGFIQDADPVSAHERFFADLRDLLH